MLTKLSRFWNPDPTSRRCSPISRCPAPWTARDLHTPCTNVGRPSRSSWLVSGQLKLANIEVPADSRFFGKPLEANEMIAEMQSMIGQP